MRIGVIGAGISGMLAARRLHDARHEIALFEAGDYVGGHTHTVDLESAGQNYSVDTGFIVFNDWTYPRFIALLDELGVAWQPSAMSFSVRSEHTGLEYNGTSLNTLFAQRLNFARPSFLRMVQDILRFNRHAPSVLATGAAEITLGAYLEQHAYSRYFVEHYIIPMGAAVWSSQPRDMLTFPARFFVEFFANHGFLNVSQRPIWRVVQGGSREYVKRLTAPFAARIRLKAPVESIARQSHQIAVRLRSGTVEHFDRVFLCCHSDQAKALLSDASGAENEILGAIQYQENEAVLHTDARLMPRNRRAWAAWNYYLPTQPAERVTVSYNMNILQSLQSREQFLVSLNPAQEIDPSKVLHRYVYHHPAFTLAAVAAQRRRGEINGINRTYYCGAYWGYGFHEDGVNSAMASLAEFERREAHAQPHLQRVG